jgi:hypothetical protein
MEELTQVVAGARLRRVRPERDGQARAGLRGLRMEEQIGEERLQPRGRGVVDGLAVDGQSELTEETNPEYSGHLKPPSAPGPRRYRSGHGAASVRQ